MTRFYVDDAGVYLGGYIDSDPLIGAIEVPAPPADAREIWDGQAWSLPLEILRGQKRAQINRIREEKIASGLVYDFPDGSAGTVDSAEQRDFDNVQALTTMAQELRTGGQTDPVLTFVDKEDQPHTLTPQQMIDLGLALTTRVAAIYTASWGLKQLIKDAASVPAVEALDLEAGWP